ncbi:hypothetical protein A5757_16900 [Mycobacterium sp. 852013-51886_SCH5428379]|uniref:DUF4235 domain-containing protein n=1 Tax=Mycobacterium sp. 852013-51886_SCH5428379 TaxID=1834111 RepID=UPI0007FEE4C7|nr:DUF4235 domain-containing protein [Mycobacterium sp. 852013-51886_SCH5428379]OBB58351.1 hypothetical protein A5757_16900 [Mycobacterium sp. 852013-51886_SCH5428379]
MSAAKQLYKPLSVASSVLGGLLAGKIFTEVYHRVNPSGGEPPDPTDLSTSTRDIFIAAAVQGLIVGVVRAALARGQAKGFHAITKEDPEV